MISPVRSQASPPPAALSGETFRIEGLSDVPDWRPSPTVGSHLCPLRIIASGGCLLTTSADPGQPITPAPRMTRMLSSSRSEEHTSELPTLMRLSYDASCLK